jgi:hypothetical protein
VSAEAAGARLGAAARARRASALALLVAGLVAGTLWGEDDHFPFAPMRMYAHTTRGSVKELKLMAVTASGREIPVRFAEVTMRRAEVAGQVPRFEADPSLLRHLASAYHQRQTEAEPLRELRLLYLVYPLGPDGSPVGVRERVVAVWRRA